MHQVQSISHQAKYLLNVVSCGLGLVIKYLAILWNYSRDWLSSFTGKERKIVATRVAALFWLMFGGTKLVFKKCYLGTVPTNVALFLYHQFSPSGLLLHGISQIVVSVSAFWKLLSCGLL
jgi:hypothetical protein